MNVNRSENSRRDFLKKGISGAVGISLLPAWGKGEENKNGSASKSMDKKKIIYRTLGKTGIKVPIISFGCGSTQNGNLVRAALEMGMRHLDTAHGYGGGENETMLGEVLKGRPRHSFVVATKIEPPRDNRTGLISKVIGKAFSPAELRKDVREKMAQSLKRLGLDYVDILYMHDIAAPDNVRFQLVKDIFLELKREGKTKFLGVSTHQNEAEVIRAVVEEKIYDMVLTAYNFRQPHREEVKKAVAYAANAGLGVVGMKMLAGVYWDRERKHPINATAAFKWVLQDENVHTLVPGITTFDQLEADMSVMEALSLTPREKADLEHGEKIAMTGLYCSQCGRCRSRCRYGLDIPTLMRCYMYAYGYKEPAKAKEILQGKDSQVITCRECSPCAVSCTMGFDVPGKIKDITRIIDVPDDFLV
jgi:predicted aldo/keto reductase-like oxidoreductase